MSCKPDEQILSEPVPIGNVTAPNRFFAAPHATGTGSLRDRSTLAIKREKARGGWGTVCTEHAEIHASSDMTPSHNIRFWGTDDQRLATEIATAIHDEGSLAALELTHSGANASNFGSYEPALSPSGGMITPTGGVAPPPLQTRMMDRDDIREFRQWHRDAVGRAIACGFDVAYVYAIPLLSLPGQFLSASFNRRSDEYGGPLQNRLRLLRELIEDAGDAAAGRCAIAVRIAVADFLDPKTGNAELHELFDDIGTLPDLWDVIVHGMSRDAGGARSSQDPGATDVLREIKRLTAKPVVSGNTISDPGTMAQMVRDDVVDLFSAARPSIADPFLPKKMMNGRADQVTHCIKCNICIAGVLQRAPSKCTQNPTFGEQYRRSWRADTVPPRRTRKRVAVVGAGPAGLECAATLGERGYDTVLFERTGALGGRAARESALPGLESWSHIVSDRVKRIARLTNVSIRTGVDVTDAQLQDEGIDKVFLATGASWDRKGGGRCNVVPSRLGTGIRLYTPDDIMAGRLPAGRVLIHDEDQFYMGSTIAGLLAGLGCTVSLSTPASVAAPYTVFTMEQRLIQQRLLRSDVRILPNLQLLSADADHAELACTFTGDRQKEGFESLVLVGGRVPDDRLWHALKTSPANRLDPMRIGDALAPRLLSHAVFSGHKAAREFELDASRDPLDDHAVEQGIGIRQRLLPVA
ncbi:MAG: FAD-dependent oxidoreductase [Rhodospirillaceae bacterium]|nr:FAD-dependent oxidoreductase [Rhodospirillaceae bacterium]